MRQPRRARELGITVGTLPTGAHNAITDVPGIRVGHTTLVEGASIRTGVTAVVPEQLLTRPALPAGLAVGNGYGKLVGSTQLVELGEIETPIVLTATLSTFRAADALVTYMLGLPGRERSQSVNPVVGETNDGYLSDIRARPITQAHVLAALRSASGGLVAEGCVGAGTGTVALGFKAGIGTSSRVLNTSAGEAIVGVLVQANFSGVLRVGGVAVPPERVGAPAAPASPAPNDPAGRDLAGPELGGPELGGPEAGGDEEGNSCVFVIATGARLDARQLSRLARRAIFAMGRVGSDFTSGSGDYALALSTAATGAPLPESDLDPLFGAVLEAAEESLLNSLVMARTTAGRAGHIKPAVPHDRLLALLDRPAAGR